MTPAQPMARPAASFAVRYGLALASVASAFGLSKAFLHFNLPLPFNGFALTAIAITFWYGGANAGIFAAVLAAIVRGYFFDPALTILPRLLYDLIYLIFALLMAGVIRARKELELRVAERTAELTRTNQELKLEIAERKRAEAELRASEAYLAEAQKLSHTGSWARVSTTGKMRYYSEECYRVLGFEPRDGLPRFESFLQRVHPDDQARLRDIAETASREKAEYEVDYRIVHPGGEIRNIHTVGHPVLSQSGDLIEFVGTVIDVTERKRSEHLTRQAEEALRQARADLARVNRVTTMGELTASLAHEINQPIAAAVTNANTCLRWLNRDQPDLEEARAAASRAAKDANRAAGIIRRIRQLFTKATAERSLVDINEVIQEMVFLLRSEATRHNITVRTDVAENLPLVSADRVQLQQVLMNLMINGIEAMKDVNGVRELAISSQPADDQHLMVKVSDTGAGLPPQQEDLIFTAFFTTKPHGTGMGLSISRSIVESHGGRLWAAGNSPRGASFSFTLPATDPQA
jgi:PAS domain S-box-containing protein